MSETEQQPTDASASEPPGRTDWDGAAYQARFDALAKSGKSMHGEVDFVERLWSATVGGEAAPGSVLDAGCGTGRVGIELHRRGWTVVGADVDASMLATARSQTPEVEWHLHDLASAEFNLGQTFDVVLLAGNVPLFTPAGTVPALVAGCGRHVADGGLLVCGFSLGRGVTTEEFDQAAGMAGLELVDRLSTWDGDPFGPDADYQLSIHRRSASPS